MRAHLVIAARAVRAGAAAQHERHRHPCAHPPAPHVRADRHDLARQLVAGHVAAARRCRDRGPASRANRCGRCRWPARRSPPRRAAASGSGTLCHVQGPAEGVVDDRAHRVHSLQDHPAQEPAQCGMERSTRPLIAYHGGYTKRAPRSIVALHFAAWGRLAATSACAPGAGT